MRKSSTNNARVAPSAESNVTEGCAYARREVSLGGGEEAHEKYRESVSYMDIQIERGVPYQASSNNMLAPVRHLRIGRAALR